MGRTVCLRQTTFSLSRGVLRIWSVLVLCCTLLMLSGCNLPDLQGGSFGQTTVSGKSATVRVQILHGGSGSVLVLVPVTIEGYGPYKFALDTGASITIVSNQIADSLQLPTVGKGQPVSGVGGSVVAIPVSVKTWSVGKVALPAAVITRGDLPDSTTANGLDGLLGSDILSKFGQITIDYNAKTVTFANATSA